VDHPWVVAGDVLAHRDEPRHRVGRGAAQHGLVLDDPHGTVRADQIVDLGVDDDLRALGVPSASDGEPEGIDAFDHERADVEDAATFRRNRTRDGLLGVRGDRWDLDADLGVIAGVDDRGATGAESGRVADPIVHDDRVATRDPDRHEATGHDGLQRAL
jgi:hypothetical protein